MLAIRDGAWKLLFNPDGSRVELYDIPRQPMELHSQAEAHPEVVARLRELALAWQKTLPDGPRTENPGSLDYPGYHEAPGRGPLLDRAKYEDLLQPLGVGTEDLRVLRHIRASGYSGPIGILNHTQEDAEGRLLDNLDGLQWLLPQLDDQVPASKPKYRTWQENETR
jgi:hypothetical protein